MRWKAAVGRRIEGLVRKALHGLELLQGCHRLLIALSGGKDSLTLLHMLAAIVGRGVPKVELHAAHVEGTFGCGAGVDLGYLQNTCDELSIPLHRLVARQSEPLACYSCARERRRLLFGLARELRAEAVAFGHHREDHMETLLMNLFHKGEFAGNLGKVPMKKYGVTIVRPLLYVPQEMIIAFAEAEGFLRVLCRCPVGQESMRKKSGLLLREIEHIFPHARANLARAGWDSGGEGALCREMDGYREPC